MCIRRSPGMFLPHAVPRRFARLEKRSEDTPWQDGGVLDD